MFCPLEIHQYWKLQSCVLPWRWAWYKSQGSPHYSVEFFHRKVVSLCFLLSPCSDYLAMLFRPEKGFWILLWPQSHGCLICAFISEIPSGPQLSCYCFWLSLLLSIKTCEEWFPAETSPVQLTSACLGERSWFWLIWAKPSLEECSCCTSHTKPLSPLPICQGSRRGTGAVPGHHAAHASPCVKTPSSRWPVPGWTGGTML